MAVVDMEGLRLSDLDKFFQVVELLEDTDGLIDKFKPEVVKYLNKEKFFKPGHQRQAFNRAFDSLIVSLIRKEISDRLSLTPEEILIVTDQPMLEMLTEGRLFNQSNYLSKEG